MAGYKCTSVGCYSYQDPPTNTLFQTLQARINQLLPVIDPSTTLIKVNGILGKGTTIAALVILDYIGQTNAGAAAAAAPGARDAYERINSPEDLANNAQFVSDIMTLYIRALGSQPVAVAPTNAAQPSAVQIATTTANAPIKASGPQGQALINNVKARKSGLSTSLLDIIPPGVAYALGGLFAVGTLAAVFIGVSKKRKGGAAPAPVGNWFR